MSLQNMTEEDRKLLSKVLSKPLQFPENFKGWLSDYIATNIPKLPISHIYGFKLEGVRIAPTITTFESTSSATFGNLATVGPQLTGVADGLYLVFYGAKTFTTDFALGTFSRMGIEVNGAAITSDNRIEQPQRGGIGESMSFMVRASNDHNNTFIAKYASDTAGEQVSFEKRWLVLFKVTDS